MKINSLKDLYSTLNDSQNANDIFYLKLDGEDYSVKLLGEIVIARRLYLTKDIHDILYGRMKNRLVSYVDDLKPFIERCLLENRNSKFKKI